MTERKQAPRRAGLAPRLAIASALVVGTATPVVTFYEGTVLYTYADPVGIPTACMGETGEHIRFGQRFTLDECRAMLSESLYAHAQGLDRCITAPLAPHEAAAILSWGYNVGVGAACRSTMVKMINAGAPPQRWCQQFDRWVYAKGFKLNGLVKRRAAERALCEGRQPS